MGAGVRTEGNVIDLFAERIRRSRENASVTSGFENDVRALMTEMTGLDYNEARPFVLGKDYEEFFRSAIDHGQTAREFMHWVAAANGLEVKSAMKDLDEVTHFNEARLAILEFVEDNRHDGWQRGIEGAAIKEIHGPNGDLLGVAQMQPIKKNDWGFGIAVHGVEAFDNEGVFIAGKQPIRKFGGFDIEDVVGPLQHYELEMSNNALNYGR